MDPLDLLKAQQLLSSLPTFSPGTSINIDIEQEKLDTAINKLENALQLLKNRRNALAFITRLSPDVLLHIFRYLQPRSPECGPIDRDSSVPFTRFGKRAEKATPAYRDFLWIRALTHVCSRWRDLAINSPTLWTAIRFHHLKWTEEVLRRSQVAPLTIIFDLQDGVGAFGLRARLALGHVLQGQLGRARHIDIAVPYTWFDEFISQKLPLVTDTLQTCILHGLKDPIEDGIRNTHFPTTFLHNSANSLRYLALSFCTLIAQPLDTPIYLSNLSQLALQNIPPLCAEVLDAISFPPTCQITIDCTVVRDQSQLFTLYPFIQRFWASQAGVGRPVKGVRFHSYLQDTFDFMMRDHDKTNDENHSYNSDRWRDCLTLRLRPVPNTGSTIIQNLWKLLPSDDLLTFDVSLNFDPDWQTLWTRCPRLQHIHLANSDLAGFLDILGDHSSAAADEAAMDDSDDTQQQQASPADNLRFPDLKTITFSGSTFTDQLCDRLWDSLELRLQLGKPVHELHFFSVGGIHRAFIDELEELVLEEVECDNTMTDDEGMDE